MEFVGVGHPFDIRRVSINGNHFLCDCFFPYCTNTTLADDILALFKSFLAHFSTIYLLNKVTDS